MIKKISKEDRANMRKSGVKIGRYHIFLPKMLKPNAVNLRIKLWKLYFSEDKKYSIPKSGLNFLKKWRNDLKNNTNHNKLLQIILDESGYSEMLKNKKDLSFLYEKI